MAEVPREAVEFARLVVRAFYPPDFIVVTDAVLRHNNYCAHHDLARRLGFQPKELRQVLVQMVHARLMRVEKRQQKRINLRDERRPTRTVNTEFWYVPLVEVIDSFSYRVHKISKEVEKRRQNEVAEQKYVCGRCQTEYQLLDILSQTNEDNEFVCTKMGVRPDRRPTPCGGIIREQDNTQQVRETERIMQKLDEELRPLRTKAEQCSNLEIPAHPLDGADEKTWGELVPETVGIYGEAVDEDGLEVGLSSQLDKPPKPPSIPASKPVVPVESKDDDFIPEKPSWFKDSSNNADDADDDWVNEQAQTVLDSKTGTAASFAAEEDEKSYYERYLKEIAGEDAAATTTKSKETEVIALDSPEEEAKAEPPPPPAAELDEEEDAVVMVAGKQMKLSEVTEEMTEKMTAEEYKAYFALAQGGGGGGADDDDDEFV